MLGSSGGVAMSARTGATAQVTARVAAAARAGVARENVRGGVRRASLGAGWREDVGGVQQRKGANGGSGSRDSLERGAVRSGREPRADA